MRCGEDLLELVGQEVVDCVRKEQETADTVMKIISNIFPVSEESKVYREQGVCIMMSRIVNKCTAMWRNCYNDKEVSPSRFSVKSDLFAVKSSSLYRTEVLLQFKKLFLCNPILFLHNFLIENVIREPSTMCLIIFNSI